MAIVEHASGTQTATIGTEHSLVTEATEACVPQIVVDTTVMLAGDIVEICFKGKVISSGSEKVFFKAIAAGAQTEVLIVPGVEAVHSWSYTLKQTAGTGRAFPWSVRRSG